MTKLTRKRLEKFAPCLMFGILVRRLARGGFRRKKSGNHAIDFTSIQQPIKRIGLEGNRSAAFVNRG